MRKQGGEIMFNKNKKMIKKILAFSMVLTMMVGLCSPAYAAEKEIDSVTIAEPKEPIFTVDGKIADATLDVEVPEGAKAKTEWKIWDDEAEDYVVVTEGNFTENDVYRLGVVVTAEDGYTLAEDFKVKGLEEDSYGVNGTLTEDGKIESYTVDFGVFTFSNQIYRVEVKTPEVKAGNKASVDEIVFYTGDEIVSHENIEIDCKWIDESTSEDVTGKTFEIEKSYQLDTTLKVKAGYSFAEEVEVYVNGEKVTGFFYPCHLEFFPTLTSFTPVDHVDIAELPEVEAGDALFTQVSADIDTEECELLVSWCDEEGDDISDETFVEGKTYVLCLEYNLFNGGTLAEDFVFVIGEKEYKPDTLNAKTGQAWLEFEYVIGKDTTGWNSDENGKFYIKEDKTKVIGWYEMSENVWYYFDKDGYLKTGWVQDGATWYYMDKTGVMQTGWVQDGATWYYLSKSGAMKTGWVQDGATWYYLSQSGAMKTGWIQDGATWYYLSGSGAMKTGWLKDGGNWYYLSQSGAMKTGWLQLGTNWFYLNANGSMAADTYIGNWYVDKDGYYIPSRSK